MDIAKVAIESIRKLIEVRQQLPALYIALGKNAEANSITYRIRSYNKWVDEMEKAIKEGIDLSTIESIKKKKYTTKLEANLVDILENGTLGELTEAQTELEKLKKEVGKETPDTSVSTTSMAKKASPRTPKKTSTTTTAEIMEIPIAGSSTPLICDTHLDKSSDKTAKLLGKGEGHIVVDIKTLRSIPKQLDGKVRPTNPKEAAVYDLTLIHGIGESGAKKYVNAGITLELLLEDWNEYVAKDPEVNSIVMHSKIPRPMKFNVKEWNLKSDSEKLRFQRDELSKKLDLETKYLAKLNYDQLVGLKHFFNIRAERIPRSEVVANEVVLTKVAHHLNSNTIVTICGSYRRGRPDSGDVDCLITHPDYEGEADGEESELLKGFIHKLTGSGYLVDHFSPECKKYYKGMAEIKGVSKCPRRIDIKVVPYYSYGAALLHATGSKNFNTSIRAHALSQGYSLNEYGLYKLVGGKKSDTPINCPTEEDIFKALNYPYKSPSERDI
jgi:hypothetical protein